MAKRENVTSREYKVMLRARLFDGDEQRMHSAIDAFWTDLTAALAAIDIPCEGSFTQVKARRLIRFFDTDEHRIKRQYPAPARRYSQGRGRAAVGTSSGCDDGLGRL